MCALIQREMITMKKRSLIIRSTNIGDISEIWLLILRNVISLIHPTFNMHPHRSEHEESTKVLFTGP